MLCWDRDSTMKIPQWLQYMVTMNSGITAHILFGAVAGKIGLMFLNKSSILIIVVVCALLWEVYEWRKSYIVETYGSYRRAILDSIGDILGTIIFCLIVIT